MTLCVDVGNTNTKIAVVSRGVVHRAVVVPSRAPVSELANAVARATRGARAIDSAMVSSVRPKSTPVVVRAIARACGISAAVVTHRSRLPLAIAVRRPGRVGTDRLCAAVGAVAGRRRSAIVIDAGSAITVDLVIDRRFLGGVILAGPTLTLAALHRETAQLPELDFEGGPIAPRRIDDTESAMRWGATLSGAGGIRAAVAMLEARAGKRLAVVLTGGHAGRLGLLLPLEWHLEPNLTLLGLELIARQNRPKE